MKKTILALAILALSAAFSAHVNAQSITNADIFDYGYLNNNLYSGDGTGFVDIPTTNNSGFLPFQRSLTSSGLLTITLTGNTVINRYRTGIDAETLPITSLGEIQFEIYYNGPVYGFTGINILSNTLFTGGESISAYLNGDVNSSYGFIINVNASGGAFGNISVGNIGSSLTAQLTSVPEPSTYALFGLGALALVIVARRKQKA
jgi:hypothetical protein